MGVSTRIEEIEEIVAKLFANGKRPSDFYGINGKLIEEVELKHPEVAKQYPR